MIGYPECGLADIRLPKSHGPLSLSLAFSLSQCSLSLALCLSLSHMYIYAHIYICVCIYIHIYRQIKKERERESGRARVKWTITATSPRCLVAYNMGILLDVYCATPATFPCIAKPSTVPLLRIQVSRNFGLYRFLYLINPHDTQNQN